MKYYQHLKRLSPLFIRNKGLVLLFLLGFLGMACGEGPVKVPTAQEIVDRSIAASGGENFKQRNIAFTFRDLFYRSEWRGGNQALSRLRITDTTRIEDVLFKQKLQRRVNDSIVVVSDSLAHLYANSINSVHYFATLPYRLNDPAVKKEYLGEIDIKGKTYYKVQITFEQAGGGDDYEDVYVYWFNKETYLPDYLAYEFHTDKGGLRFRAAYNERYVNGIRFVDYENYEASPQATSVFKLDSLFEGNHLKLLSKIVLEEVEVSEGSVHF